MGFETGYSKPQLLVFTGVEDFSGYGNSNL